MRWMFIPIATVLYLFPLKTKAQFRIDLIVYDVHKKPISNALVSIYDTSKKSILAQGFTNPDGKFGSVIFNSKVHIASNALGYKQVDTLYRLSKIDSIHQVIIYLYPAVKELNEVIVHANSMITERGDTISIKSKYFSDGSETVLEDLLKKMPGLDITNDGVIRVNGKEIEKIMVEGDDFFDKGYKLLSKNMPPGVVDKVEVIQRYEAQRLRKGLKESDKVALNLRLTDDAKRKWFGNIDAYTSPLNTQYYNGRVNLMNFRKKLKYYLLGTANSIGQNIDISLIDQLGGVTEDMGNEKEQQRDLTPPVSFRSNSISLPDKRYSFNRMLLHSGNIILRPFANTKIRIGVNRFSDRLETSQVVEESVLLRDTAFINKESSFIQRMPVTYLGKLNWQTEIDSSSSFHADIYWLGTNTKENAMTSFNTKPLYEQNNFSQSYLIYKVALIKRISETKFLQASFLGNRQSLPLQYTNQPFLPTGFFNISATVNSLQVIQQNRNDFSGNINYIHRLSKSTILEGYMGFNMQNTKQFAELSFNNKDSNYEAGNDFKGSFSLNQQKIFAKISLNKKWKSLSIIPSLELISIKQNGFGFQTNRVTNSFLNPTLTIGYQLNKKHKFLGVFGFSNSVPDFEDIQPIYRMSGFRSFQRGSNRVQPIQQSTNILSYTFGNWADRLFINVFYLGILDYTFLGTNMIIDPAIVFSEKIWLQDKQMQSLNANADLFVKQINSNLKLVSQLSNANFYNVVNGSSIRKIETTSLSVGIESKSVFKGCYNHHFGIKRILSKNITELRRNIIFHTSFLDFYFKLNKWGHLKIKNEGFHFPKEQVNESFLVFSDIEWSKTIIASKFSVGVYLSNLLNQTRFTNISLSDISISKNTTILLPRILSLRAEYRF